jgi:hypothetical protein
MTAEFTSVYSNVTLTDVQLAEAYYPILVDLAKHKHCITYQELVERAKAENLGREVVQKAIPVSTGRRLDVVRRFTNEEGLPDLTCLVINKVTRECGIAFPRSFDPAYVRAAVFSFDWEGVNMNFAGFVRTAQREVQPRRKLKEQDALVIMFDYYRKHKATLPSSIAQFRDLIVELLRDGVSPESAFAQAQTEFLNFTAESAR